MEPPIPIETPSRIGGPEIDMVEVALFDVVTKLKAQGAPSREVAQAELLAEMLIFRLHRAVAW